MLILLQIFTSELKTFERRSGGHFFRRPIFLPGIEFLHFGAVAAKFHAAPAAVVIFAGIEKEPLAGGRRASADVGQLVGCEQVGGRARDWPQEGRKTRAWVVEAPLAAFVVLHQPGMQRRFVDACIKSVHRYLRDLLLLSDC